MPTLTEITKGLEEAVKAASSKKDKLDLVRNTITAAENDYGAAMAVVRELHTLYSEFMSHVLTGFGSTHK